MSVVLLSVAYDGRDFAGWQRQDGERTVQGCLELALARIAGQPVAVRGAGRTDAGVHAAGQRISFDWSKDLPLNRLLLAVNANLPDDVAVRDPQPCADGFDIKRDSLAKRYVYRIARSVHRPVLDRQLVWHHRGRLDVAAMQAAAAHLVGELDFESFRNAGCQAAHARRCVWCVDVEEQDERLQIDVRGNAFVRGMVRVMVGTLVEVGRGAYPADEIPAILAARDRRRAGFTAPAHGLTLDEVYLPGDEVRAGIPDWARWPGFRAPREP